MASKTVGLIIFHE